MRKQIGTLDDVAIETSGSESGKRFMFLHNEKSIAVDMSRMIIDVTKYLTKSAAQDGSCWVHCGPWCWPKQYVDVCKDTLLCQKE